MALSMKNTLVSLSFSATMLFAGFLSGTEPLPALKTGIVASAQNQSELRTDESINKSTAAKKIKRAFTTPYFSFGKSNLPTGVR